MGFGGGFGKMGMMNMNMGFDDDDDFFGGGGFGGGGMM